MKNDREVKRHKADLERERQNLKHCLRRMGYDVHTGKEAEVLARWLARRH